MPAVTTKNNIAIDPATGQAKQNNPNAATGNVASTQPAANNNPTVPYAQPNQNDALIPIIKAKAPATAATVAQGNTEVLSAAQQGALNAQNKANPTMDLVQQKTQELLKQPLGYDKNAYTQAQLEAFDRNRANAMLSFQQGLGDISNSGINREKAYNFTMQGAQERSLKENELAQQQAEAERNAMLSALTAGQDVSKTQSGLDQTAFQRLLDTRNVGEGERSQTTGFEYNKVLAQMGYDNETQQAATQNGYDLAKMDKAFGQDQTKLILAANLDETSKSNLMNLQDKIDTKKLLTQQDFTALQSDLNRKLEVAKQDKDITATENLTKLKATLDLQAQEAQNQFTKELTASTQAWQHGENVDKNTLDLALQANEIALKQSMQDKDIDTEKYLQDQKNKLELAMQTNGMDQETKMAYLKNDFDTAMADGNVGRQQQIIEFQTAQDLTKIEKEQGYTEANKYLDNKLAIALQNNDAANVSALTATKLQFEATQNDKNRAIEQARVDLEAKGVDMKKAEQTYTMLQAEVEAGRADPSVLTAYTQGLVKTAGVTITPPDPMAAQKAAISKNNAMMYQFGLTHPDMVTYSIPATATTGAQSGLTKEMVDKLVQEGKLTTNDVAGLKTTLNPNGVKAYTEFFNSATYGELTQEEKDRKANAGYLGDSDVGIGADGDKFNFTKEVKTQGGATVPPGKYYVQGQEAKLDEGVIKGEATGTDLYLVNEATGEKYLYKVGDKSNTDRGIVKKVLDPFDWFGL